MSYAYDLACRLTGGGDTGPAIPSAVPPSGDTVQYAAVLTYDPRNRPLTASWNPAAVQTTPSASSASFTFAYDPSNRRISQSASDIGWWSYPTTAGSTAYTANNLNQYSAVGAVSPSYDGNGNLTYDGTFTYAYDAENRLTSVKQGAATVATYAYDAQGRRQSRTAGGATTLFATDAEDREVLEYDGASGAVTRWYAFGLGPEAVLGQMNVALGTRTTLIPDIQGSIIGTLDSGSGTLSRIGYQPFGENPTLTSGTYRYTAQRFDPETAGSTAQPSGLYYYRARHYSPTWGRFLQPDPIGYAAGNNLYAYVNNDPLNITDPDGQCPWCIGALTSVVLGGVIRGVTGGNVFDWQVIGTDAALGAVGAGVLSKISTVVQLGAAGAGISKARYLGNIGEAAIGAGERSGIKVGGRTLFPDIVGQNGLQEAKNVAVIGPRDARQIAAYANYSATRGLDPLQVFTRPGTDVSAIQGLIDSGSVVQKILPGVNKAGVWSLPGEAAAAAGAAAGAADNLPNGSMK